ncbi:hypothetical protein LPJ53_001068 [Coemansia erecta]|uniref:CUE domain-containing protein n=1 Tax=Coemansia erecta TaxID=147472 RepID=A0A9W8CVB4_9FUNG|nr:hypothetical protein LPJ53_001068 [Coemansia erecta]
MTLGVGGLEGAPTTRLWLTTAMLAFAVHQLLSSRPTTLLSRTLQTLTFGGLHTMVPSLLLIYHQRTVERQLGPRKYASHLAVFLLVIQMASQLLPLQTANGACSLLAACLALFAQHVPSVDHYSVHVGRVRIGDRWMAAALAAYLAVCLRALAAAAVGIGAALVVAGNVAGLRVWRLPEWVGTWLEGRAAAKVPGRRPPPAGEQEIGLLSGMFPGVERSLVEQALALAANDVSRAAAVLLDNTPPASQ